MPADEDQIDSAIEIVTPENIAFRYELAGPFRRGPAYMIDFAIRIAVIVVLGFLLAVVGIFLGGASGAIFLLLLFVMEWFYGTLFETYWNGQTPGKRMMGLRVLSQDGQPITGLQAVVRNILRFADMMPPIPMGEATGSVGLAPTCLIGLLTSMFNPRMQRLGDLVSGTIVVVEDRGWLPEVARLDDPAIAELAEQIPANFRLDRQARRAVASYVERRHRFPNARRWEIAKFLAVPLIDLLHLPSNVDYDLLVCAIYYRAFIADRGQTQLKHSLVASQT